jgi:hypothetical protein
MTWEPTITEGYETALRGDGNWWYYDIMKKKWHGPYGTNGVAILKAKKGCGE